MSNRYDKVLEHMKRQENQIKCLKIQVKKPGGCVVNGKQEDLGLYFLVYHFVLFGWCIISCIIPLSFVPLLFCVTAPKP